jgi:hypothetical protein
MRFNELTRLYRALVFLGLDNGGNPDGKAIIPSGWEARALQADAELVEFTDAEFEILAGGEETEIAELAKRAPAANEVLNAAFDGGELSHIMNPWRSIYDARDAEAHAGAHHD